MTTSTELARVQHAGRAEHRRVREAPVRLEKVSVAGSGQLTDLRFLVAKEGS